MTVYKTVKEDNKSAHYNFQYWPHNTYHADALTVDNVNSIESLSVDGKSYEQVIQEGYHSFQASGVRLRGGNVIVSKLNEQVMAFTKFGDKLVKFTIPKGATYYYGVNGDVVSDQIISGDLKEIDPTTVIAPVEG